MIDLCYGIVAVTCVVTSLWCGVVVARLANRIDEGPAPDPQQAQRMRRARAFLLELATPGSDLSAGHVRAAARDMLRDMPPVEARNQDTAEGKVEADHA